MITHEQSNQYFDECFAEHPVMVILRGYSPEEAVRISRRAWEIGITNIEVTLQDSTGVDALRAVIDAAGTGAAAKHVGAGTITTAQLAHTAAHLGARYTVAPGIDADVATASLAAGVPHLPGVATASEIGAAQRLGLDWVKAFPAHHLGPQWVRSMHGPFPAVRVIATGGIDTSNAGTFLAGGVSAVALGSALTDETQLDGLRSLMKKTTVAGA